MRHKEVHLSERKLRILRLRYWKQESKRLRREHRGLLFGAAMLIFALMTAYSALLGAAYLLIKRYFILTDTFTVIYVSVSVFLGLLLYGLLFVGGKRLALSFYGEGKTDGINPLFYAFSGARGFAGSMKIIFSFIIHIFWMLAAALITYVLWRGIGNPLVLAIGAILFLLMWLAAEKHSLEWLFIMKMKGKRKSKAGAGYNREYGSAENGIELKERRGYADRMSRYAMSGRGRESLGASLCSLFRFLIGGALFGVGLLFVYFPYAWTLDAARCACIAEELCSGKGQL